MQRTYANVISRVQQKVLRNNLPNVRSRVQQKQKS